LPAYPDSGPELAESGYPQDSEERVLTASGSYGQGRFGKRRGKMRREGLNLLDGTWYADDPHAIWTELRREAPILYDAASEVWGISRYQDVLTIEKDPERFSSRTAPRPHGESLPMMISMDDPDHQRRRSLVNRGFTPRQIADQEDTVRDFCRLIINRVSEKGECDFVWDIAAPLPLMVIADMLGLSDMQEDLLRWSEQLMRATPANPPPEMLEAGAATIMEFRESQLKVIADRRTNPRDDLITTLCQAEIDGEALDDDSIVQETLLILIGGDETTRHVISGGMLALMENPQQFADLRAGSADLVLAVEEMIRWVSPIQNMARTVTRNLTFQGHAMRDGDQVILFYPSANRDEDVFDDPHQFDIRRQPNPHIAFGFGRHFCLGASLARLELRVMFSELFRRLPDIQLAAAGPLPRRSSNFVSGLEEMPVRFSPAPVEADLHAGRTR
jgi:cholest-4-en-3-one 26-monooxygenase